MGKSIEMYGYYAPLFRGDIFERYYIKWDYYIYERVDGLYLQPMEPLSFFNPTSLNTELSGVFL